MTTDIKTKACASSRREFLGNATAAMTVAALAAGSADAQPRSNAIKAVAFDAFAIFDSRPVFRLVEELFPGKGKQISDQWRSRQFEYTWLRNSMQRYADFWQVTEDALDFAMKQAGVNFSALERSELMSAYLQLSPWPDVLPVIEILRKRGLRLALLTNWTAAMQQVCVHHSGMGAVFEFQLSTDHVRRFKPDPVAYHMGLEAFRLQKQEIAFVAFSGWDAAGAKAFGYPTYWSNRLNLPPEELGANVDATYRDLSLLPTFIDAR